jgi:hypothetical protein
LNRFLTLLFLAQNKHSLTVGAGNQIISSEKGIVELRRKLHIATETGAVPGLGHRNTPALLAQHPVTPHH